MTTYQRVFYRIGQVSGLVLVLGLCRWAELQMSYMGWLNFPQFEIGLTPPHEVKGIAVYISPKNVEWPTFDVDNDRLGLSDDSLPRFLGRAEQDVDPTEAAASTGILAPRHRDFDGCAAVWLPNPNAGGFARRKITNDE